MTAGVDLLHDLGNFPLFLGEKEGFDEDIGPRQCLQGLVEIVPKDAVLPVLQGDDIGDIRDGHPALGVVPEDVGDELARLARRVNGEFDIFHAFIIEYRAEKVNLNSEGMQKKYAMAHP